MRATSRRDLNVLLRNSAIWFITISIMSGLNMGGGGYNLRTRQNGANFCVSTHFGEYETVRRLHPQPPVFKPRTIEIVMNQMAEFRSNTLRSLRDIARQKNQPSTLKI